MDGKGDFADMIKIMNPEMERRSWIIQMSTI